MSLLITGHLGFVGGYLLKTPGTVGLMLSDGAAADLLAAAELTDSIARIRPSAVIHLAAQSSVPTAFGDPLSTYQANFLGTHNLLSALKATGFVGRFLYVSTAEVYGQTDDQQLPTSEDAPTTALNPYAVSKLAAEALCRYWDRVEGIEVVLARPFNHIGPGQSTRFAISDFAKVITEISLGQRAAVLQVGDLQVTRDFTDVRDVVAAYLLLLSKGQRGLTYNVCSGIEQNMAEAVDTLASLAGVNITVQQDPSRLRKASQSRSRGDNSLLVKHTGWQPRISWQQSLQDILNDWKLKLQ